MEQKSSASRKAWLTTFCVGNVGYEMLYEFFKNFQNFFLTEICQFSTTLTATVITVVNIAKAIFTPISGMLIDMDPFKAKDKHTPWIRLMSAFLGGLFILMAFLAWQGGNKTLILVIFSIFYLLPVLLQNGYRSSISSIAMNSNEASFLAAGVNTGSNVGRLLTGIIAPVIMVKMSADGVTEDAQGFFWAVVVSVAIAVLVYWISAAAVKKTIRPDRVRGANVAKAAGEAVKKSGNSLGAMIKQIFTDKNILIPFIIGLGIFFRTFVVAPSAPYYFKYITGNMLQYATFSTATNIAGIIAVIVCPIILVTVFKNKLKITLILFTAMLTHSGKVSSLTIADMLPEIGMGVFNVMLRDIEHHLDNPVKLPGHMLSAITEKGTVFTKTDDQSTVEVEADYVVLALGLRKREEVIKAFDAVFNNVITLGENRRAPGRIAEAISDGFEAAYGFQP